jgi:hypothetical protein
METLMKTLQPGNGFDRENTPRSLSGSSVRHRTLAVLLVLAIAAVAIAFTGKQLSVGGNLILAPGQPGLEAALY